MPRANLAYRAMLDVRERKETRECPDDRANRGRPDLRAFTIQTSGTREIRDRMDHRERKVRWVIVEIPDFLDVPVYRAQKVSSGLRGDRALRANGESLASALKEILGMMDPKATLDRWEDEGRMDTLVLPGRKELSGKRCSDRQDPLGWTARLDRMDSRETLEIGATLDPKGIQECPPPTGPKWDLRERREGRATPERWVSRDWMDDLGCPGFKEPREKTVAPVQEPRPEVSGTKERMGGKAIRGPTVSPAGRDQEVQKGKEVKQGILDGWGQWALQALLAFREFKGSREKTEKYWARKK